MGLSNTTLGCSTGIIFFVMPQLMAARHVPELKIAAITAVASSAFFWSVFFAPILDVRFSRRWYATILAALSGIAAAILSSSALGGWLSNITPKEHKNPLSKWLNIALFSGTGLTSAAGGEFVRRLPVIPAAILIGTIVFLPAAIFLFIPSHGPDRRLAGESFVQFNRE